MPLYLGRTLFEAFYIRGQLDDYMKLCRGWEPGYVEVSDGSISISHTEKCRLISDISRHVTVLSEVGSKDAEHIIPPYKWIELMRAELAAGSAYVIAEARKSGNVGIYRGLAKSAKALCRKSFHRFPQEKSSGKPHKKSSNFISSVLSDLMSTLAILRLRK